MVSSTPWPHFTPRKEPVHILQEAGWASGPGWTGGKSRPHRDSIPDRPARRQSLYRLSYRAHIFYLYVYKIYINFKLCISGILCLVRKIYLYFNFRKVQISNSKFRCKVYPCLYFSNFVLMMDSHFQPKPQNYCC